MIVMSMSFHGIQLLSSC